MGYVHCPFIRTQRPGKARRGEAWQGDARRGWARRGQARRGIIVIHGITEEI
jgi:hypothetical protein